ncbi:hypothetical protein D6D06_04529, partial [Aureobasidium pullulans]
DARGVPKREWRSSCGQITCLRPGWSRSAQPDRPSVHLESPNQGGSEALALADVACDISNKTPATLPLERWNAPQSHGHSTIISFVEIVTLMTWKPDLDFDKVHSDWSVAYIPKMRSALKHELRNHLFAHPRFPCILSDRNRVGDFLQDLSVRPGDVNVSVVKRDCNIPEGFWFAQSTTPDYAVKDEASDSASWQLLRWIYWSLAGFCGTVTQLREMIDDLSRPFLLPHVGRKEWREHEVLNGEAMFKAPRIASHHIYFVASAELSSHISMKDGSAPSPRASSPKITSNSTIILAYIHQRGIDALASAKVLHNVLLSVLQAADKINRRDLTETDAIANRCDPQAHQYNERVCMSCGTVCSYHDTYCHPRNRALLCAGCRGNNDPFMFVLVAPVEYQFRRLASSINTIDKIHGPFQWKRPDMEASMEHQFNVSTYRWRNAYGNHDFDVRNAVYNDEFSGRRTNKQ